MLFEDPNQQIVAATIRCVGDLDARPQATNVTTIFKNQSQPKEVRVAALNVLKDFGNAEEAIALGLGDKALRVESLKTIGTNANPQITAKALEIAANQPDLRTLQAALGALSRLSKTNGLKDLKIPAEVRLDFAQAVNAPISNDMLLVGGDAAEGKKIYEEKTEVACTRCHIVNGGGGTVGPALDGIGARQSREYLLESITAPNKIIAKGFEAVVITLTDQRTFNGALLREDDVIVELNSPDDGRLVIKKRDIRSMVKSLSAMPEGLSYHRRTRGVQEPDRVRFKGG
jgi:quinoprotein glucose dehydrogenase